jgi:hypothetical protein
MGRRIDPVRAAYFFYGNHGRSKIKKKGSTFVGLTQQELNFGDHIYVRRKGFLVHKIIGSIATLALAATGLFIQKINRAKKGNPPDAEKNA